MTGGLCLLAGVLAGLGMARTPTSAWMWAAAVGVAAASWPAWRGSRPVRALAAVVLGMLLVAGTIAHWRALVVVPATADMRVLLDARIRGTPARVGTEVRFDADVRVLSGPVDARERRARLEWRDAPFVPRAGERWRLLVRVGPLADTQGLAGPEPARTALRDRIHLVGRVLPATFDERLALAPASIDATRARIATRIHDAVADPDAAALLAALAVGITDGVTRDQWRVFNATGTTHLVAISGLHVTLFALVAFAVARMVWRWSPFIHAIEREAFAASAGLVAAGMYTLLSGGSVPAQRTWLMLAVFVGARLAARAAGAGRTWAVALLAVLCTDPLAPLSAGFWLSFVAVGVLLVVGQSAGWRAPRTIVQRVRAALRLQLAVTSLLAPLTVAVFGGVSAVGLGVNLVAIPAISFVFVPLVLSGAVLSLAAPGWDAPVFEAAAFLYEHLWPALVRAADVEVAVWRVAPPAWWYALASVGAAVALWRFPLALRLTVLAALLPCPGSRPPSREVARMTVLDAGRGAAILLETRTRLWLIDTGDSWGSGGARVRQFVIPALDSLGRDLDELVLPALDPDRAAGAATLMVERGIGAIRLAGGWPGSDLPIRRCRESWGADGVRVEAFEAGPGGADCVLRIRVGSHALLVGGDLDAAAERALIARLGAPRLASAAVILSRHASALGSSREWIEATRAGLAIATGGVESRSRMQALERWRRAGARVVDTRVDGTLLLELRPDGVHVLAIARRSRYPFAWRRLP